MNRLFADRTDAGRQLAAKLAPFKRDLPVVLAIPRGGVPVGFEVARALEAPLDIVLVRKIGAPDQPELAVGAVVDGDRPEIVLNEQLVRELGVSSAFLEQESARQLQEIERRRKIYLGGRARPAIDGRTVILVDDGIATGATTRAALVAVRRAAPKQLVLAVPVAPPSTVERLRPDVDALICLEISEGFFAIAQFYRVFAQVEDGEVIALLDRAARSLAAGEHARQAARHDG